MLRILLLSFLTAMALTRCAFTQEKDASAQIITAVEVYTKSIESAKSAVLLEIDKKLEAVQKSGDLKSLEKLQAEKNKFLLEGILPSAINAKQYELVIGRAKSKVIESYQNAIKGYTRDGELDRAKALQAELDNFRNPRDSQGKVVTSRTFWLHSSGYFLRGDGEDWFEKWGAGKPQTNLYKEVQANDEFIELKHNTNPMSVRIYADRIMVKDAIRGQKEFSKIYEGSWAEMKPR